MTILQDVRFCVVKTADGYKVVIYGNNGCEIRTLDGGLTTGLSSMEHQNCGHVYWRDVGLKYLGCTKKDIVFQGIGTIAFPDLM